MNSFLFRTTYGAACIFFALATNAQEINYPKVSSPVGYGDVVDLPSRTPDHTIAYTSDSEWQFGQLWLPPENNTQQLASYPTIIFIHGGCWLSEYDITHTNALSTALSQAGFLVWSLEYRRVGNSGGGWPGTFSDIAQGIDYIRELAVGYPIDLNAVALMGHSAGGHLALWAVGRQGFDQQHPFYQPNPFIPKAVIGLAAITDLPSYAAISGSCNSAAQQLMGGSIADLQQRYSFANPIVASASIGYILFQGRQDNIVPMSQAKAFASFGTSNVTLSLIENAGHFDLIHPGTDAWQTVLDALTQTIGGQVD